MNNVVLPQLFMCVAIIAIFYFVLLRPQQNQRKKHERSLHAIKKGDEVVTAGGLVGEVVHIRALGTDGATTLEDRVTIKSGESRVIVERGRITRIASNVPETTKSNTSSSSPT